MQIKRRDMKLNGHYEGKKEYYSKKAIIGKCEAVVSIIKFKEIDEPYEIHYNFKDETIIDSNYTWIQIALKNTNYWVKAMYDEKDKLVEVYIDVTKGNYFDNEDNPEYEDMFLDVVIPKKGHIYSMDEVELMKAYRENIISEDEYKNAKIVCHNLMDYLNLHTQEFLDYLSNLKKELENDLKGQK